MLHWMPISRNIASILPTREFDVIYINGDNNLENLRLDDEQWKVVLIETEFNKRMWEE